MDIGDPPGGANVAPLPSTGCARASSPAGPETIRALEDALVHEPRRGGLLRLRDRWWQSRYRQPVERLLIELERGSEGEVPAERVYPRITLWGLVFDCATVGRRGLDRPRPEPMTRPLSALLLLAAFGFGLLLGPHPCGASHAVRESAQASCHEPEPSPAGPQVHAGLQEDGGDCCGTFCPHACHVTATAAAGPMAFAIPPVSGTTVEPSGSGLPLFAHPIDHIPLV